MRNLGVLGRIPAGLVMNCKMTLRAYYGNNFRVAAVLIREGFLDGAHGIYWDCVCRISDKVGWTKLIPIPGMDGAMRHGRNCPHNCQDMECIEKAVPLWFKKLTRWHR